MFGIFDKMKGAAGALAGRAADAAGAGLDVVTAILADVNAATADLHSVGYEVCDVEVSVTLPPSVTVIVKRVGEPTDEAFTALLANRCNQTTAWLMIKLTQQADRWSKSLRFRGRQCRCVALDLGLVPGVRLLFSRDAVKLPTEATEADVSAAAPNGCPVERCEVPVGETKQEARPEEPSGAPAESPTA